MSLAITTPLLKKLFPAASAEAHSALVAANDLAAGAGIFASKPHLAQFLCQVGIESKFLTRTEEDLDYRAARICVVWPTRFKSAAEAAPYAHSPRALANKVYGGRNGNTGPNDGWTYRGGGWIQITGKENYGKVGQLIGIDLVANPDYARTLDGAAATAVGFWRLKSLTLLGGDVTQVTRRVNGAMTALEERAHLYSQALALLAAA